jgi:UDP-GlcNAc:undecaprenyl-phosphate/decaprenyl-phosphate GlcNAc-1-phosphate transferase
MLYISNIPWLSLLLGFLFAALFVAAVTPFIIRYACTKKLLDQPEDRRIHTRPTPRLGGVAIFLAILLGLLIFFPHDSRLLGFELGLVIIFLVGLFDDLYNLPPIVKLSGQFLAAATIVVFGITVGTLTNPFGPVPFPLPAWLDIGLTLVWIITVINTVNLLDGLDGLATGVSGITGLALSALSLTAIVAQPDTALMSVLLAGAAFGFLIWNWHPAKIFMGDSGSHVLGFAIATLAIISGGKMATAALVLVLPLIDVVWALVRRALAGRPLFSADREHLHHLLLSVGLTQRQAVGLLYLATLGVGVSALVTSTLGKLITMLVVGVLVAIIIALVANFRRRHLKQD